VSVRGLIHWLVLAAICVGIGGCGGAYDASVSGVITLDGNKINRGTVSYIPIGAGSAAYARVDEDGSYSVQTGRESGLPPGEYDVTVVANEQPAELYSKSGAPPPPGKAITPAWYRTKQTSGLHFTVKPGRNEINLELSSKPPAGWNPRKQK